MSTGDRLHRFGPFGFDEAGLTLVRDENAIPLTPRSAGVLAVLLRQRGRVISREELEREVWGETFVDPNNLHQQIAALRKILGPEWIETIPRRGYRFPAPAPPPGPTPVPSNRPRLRIYGAALGVLALASCILLYARKPEPAPIRADSIAVLPLKTIGNHDHDEYLSLGLTDALITRMSSLRAIDVRPLSAVQEYRTLSSDAVTAGRRLHVDAVLDGTTQRIGDRMRLTFRLIEVGTGRQLWAHTYDESLGNIFLVQDRVSSAVMEAFAVRLEPATAEKRAGTDPYVAEMYLRGRHHFARRTADDIHKSAAYFQKAVTRDATFAPAWVGLGDAMHFLDRPVEAKAAAERALRLDSTLADAHATLGNILFFRERKLADAERAFLRAIELNPSCTKARHWYAYLLAVRGDMPRAHKEVEQARRIDPLSLPIMTSVGTLLYYEGRIEEAIAAYERVLDLDPHYAQAHGELAMAYAAKGDYVRAAASLVRSQAAALNDPHSPQTAYLHALRGDKRAAARTLAAASARDVTGDGVTAHAITIAATHALLGNDEAAIEWLARAASGRGGDALLIGLDQRFSRLRRNNRFQQVVRSVTG